MTISFEPHDLAGVHDPPGAVGLASSRCFSVIAVGPVL